MLFALFLVYGCGQTEFPVFGDEQGEAFVAFSSGSYSVDESTLSAYGDGTSVIGPSVRTITLTRSSSDISNELSVSVNLSATYTDDNDFVSAGEDASSALKINGDLSNIVFAANSATAEFSIVTIDDALAKGNIQVDLSIESVSDGDYQIGYQKGQVRRTSTLTVVDDDCPVNFDMLTGTFSLVRTRIPSGDTFESEVEIARDPNNPFGIIITDLLVFSTVPTTTVPLTIVTCPKALVYDQEYQIGTYTPTGDPVVMLRNDYLGTFASEASLDLDPSDPLDWAFYDDEAGEITIYCRMEVAGLGTFGNISFELTKID